jgi:hypothetical protein
VRHHTRNVSPLSEVFDILSLACFFLLCVLKHVFQGVPKSKLRVTADPLLSFFLSVLLSTTSCNPFTSAFISIYVCGIDEPGDSCECK